MSESFDRSRLTVLNGHGFVDRPGGNRVAGLYGPHEGDIQTRVAPPFRGDQPAAAVGCDVRHSGGDGRSFRCGGLLEKGYADLVARLIDEGDDFH